MISYETSHPVIFRADQPYESLVVRVPKQLLGRQEAQITKLTAIGISGTEGLPRAAVAFLRSLAAGLEDGTVTAADAPNTVECVLDLVRGLYASPALTREPKAWTAHSPPADHGAAGGGRACRGCGPGVHHPGDPGRRAGRR